MKTVLDTKTYKYKINGIDVILWRPADGSKKYGLFQQDKNGNFTIDVLNKYYNLPPHSKSKFDTLYESIINNNQPIVEISLKDIIKKVKTKLKQYHGEMISILKNDDGSFNFINAVTPEEEKNIKTTLKAKTMNVHNLTPNQLKLILSYLWPHKSINRDSEEADVNQLVDDMLSSKDKMKNIYVDVNALTYLIDKI